MSERRFIVEYYFQGENARDARARTFVSLYLTWYELRAFARAHCIVAPSFKMRDALHRGDVTAEYVVKYLRYSNFDVTEEVSGE